TPSGCFTYAFDQAKNVTELFDSAGGIAAAYDHGPFGEDMAATGSAAGLNPFRFSSEVWDGALGLVYYNWRHYNPLDGRFISRDPIEERGGLNLYGFVGNDPVNRWDYLGALPESARIVLYAKSPSDKRNRVKISSSSKVCRWSAEGNISIHSSNKKSVTVVPTAASGMDRDSKITAYYAGGVESVTPVTVIYPKYLTRTFPESTIAGHQFRASFKLKVTIYDQLGNTFPQDVAVGEKVDLTSVSGFVNIAHGTSDALTNDRGEVSDSFGATLSGLGDTHGHVNIYQIITIGEWDAVVVSQMLYRNETVLDGVNVGSLVRFNGVSSANFH
ncbi:MAG: RHS repeat-associated core domain-containing protein, partial [Kiritimatiellia bacterium]|nr:RHS repeat-associated core domain-containing protein [Kiritimatiellia bacterium]